MTTKRVNKVVEVPAEPYVCEYRGNWRVILGQMVVMLQEDQELSRVAEDLDLIDILAFKAIMEKLITVMDEIVE